MPPLATILTEPFEPPKQDTGEGFDVVVSKVGCVMVALVVAEQPFASVTV